MLERTLITMLDFYEKKLLMNNIIYLLREHQMSDSELEEKIGVSNGYLSRLAVNDSEPGIDVVCSIARCFNVALEELACLDMAKRSEKESKVISLLEKLIKDTEADKMYWDKFTFREFALDENNEYRNKCSSRKALISYEEFFDDDSETYIKYPYYNSPVSSHSYSENISDFIYVGNLAHTNVYVTIIKVTDTAKNNFFYDLYATHDNVTEIVISTLKASRDIKELFNNVIENIHANTDGVYLNSDTAKIIDQFNIFA